MRTYKYDDEVYDFISRYWKENYISPSMNEIVVETSCKSKHTLFKILRRLWERGLILYTPKIPRSYVPDWVIEAIRRV